jgi:hypothetical protein
MIFECLITKATGTNLECVIIIAFRRQQWFRDSASTLRLYVSLPVLLIVSFIYRKGK